MGHKADSERNAQQYHGKKHKLNFCYCLSLWDKDRSRRKPPECTVCEGAAGPWCDVWGQLGDTALSVTDLSGHSTPAAFSSPEPSTGLVPLLVRGHQVLGVQVGRVCVVREVLSLTFSLCLLKEHCLCEVLTQPNTFSDKYSLHYSQVLDNSAWSLDSFKAAILRAYLQLFLNKGYVILFYFICFGGNLFTSRCQRRL